MSQLLATLADAANTAATAATTAAEKPTFLDDVASIIILITAIAAFLSLGGVIVLMSIGAMATRKQLSTSWLPEQEQTFIPYENHSSSSQARAWGIALASGVVLFLFALGVKLGVDPAKQCEAGKKLDKNGKCADAQTVDRETAKVEPAKAEPKKEEPKAEEKKEEKKEEPKAEEKKEEKKEEPKTE